MAAPSKVKYCCCNPPGVLVVIGFAAQFNLIKPELIGCDFAEKATQQNSSAIKNEIGFMLINTLKVKNYCAAIDIDFKVIFCSYQIVVALLKIDFILP